MEGFNLEQVTTMIENSDLGATQKMVLTNGVQSAQDSPEVLETILDNIRQALGM